MTKKSLILLTLLRVKPRVSDFEDVPNSNWINMLVNKLLIWTILEVSYNLQNRNKSRHLFSKCFITFHYLNKSCFQMLCSHPSPTRYSIYET